MDFRLTPRAELDIQTLDEVLSAQNFGYYVKGPISQGTFAFELPADGVQPKTNAAAAQIGFRLHSTDERYVVQWKLDGLSLSRLPPYQDWETLLTEFRRVWKVYRTCCEPQNVTRVAARFINNLRLPLLANESFQLYVNKLVDIPEDAPQAVAEFVQRFQLVDPEIGARVWLTLALRGAEVGAPAPVLLDVDAFVERLFGCDEESLWAVLENLRMLKNRCFFSTITEKTASLYE